MKNNILFLFFLCTITALNIYSTIRQATNNYTEIRRLQIERSKLDIEIGKLRYEVEVRKYCKVNKIHIIDFDQIDSAYNTKYTE